MKISPRINSNGLFATMNIDNGTIIEISPLLTIDENTYNQDMSALRLSELEYGSSLGYGQKYYNEFVKETVSKLDENK